jgi:outer membrane biosynthesis protein TonB
MTMAMPYAAEDSRERRDMVIAAAFTLLYFFLFAFFWISSQTLTGLQKKAPDSPVRTNLKVQRLQQLPPMQSQFADSTGLQNQKPNTPTALQSDKDTAASSKIVNGTDPTLGGQDGKKDDSLNMRDSQFSQNQASPPPSARLSPSQAKPAKTPTPAPELPKPDLLKPTPGPGTPIEKSASDTPPDSKPNQDQTQNDNSSSAQAASDASDSSSAMAPPPDIFSSRSAVSGGATPGQDASFASMATPLGQYQSKLYRAIGSRWNLKVQQTMAQIGVDRVGIRFHVNSDGSISDIDVIQGNPNSFLGLISSEAIQKSSNMIGPFPAALKAEMPNGFPWQLNFRIY